MAKKQTSFADKAAKLGKEADATYVKYVKSVKSEKTGQWRFNEQIIRTSKSEPLDAALKRISDAENLTDIDLSEFINQEEMSDVHDSNSTNDTESISNSSAEEVAEQSLSNEKIVSNPEKQEEINKIEEKTQTDQSEEK
tara:strand:+ start:655 stop:1071 length:417 start_codon:yes stop_codon:yes gene_type:complete